MKCSGVLEAVKIRSSGYKNRVNFSGFIKNYFQIFPAYNRSVAVKVLNNENSTDDQLRKICYDLVDCAKNDYNIDNTNELIQIGKTMVFYKDEFKTVIEDALNKVRLKDIQKLQKNGRRFLINKKIREVLKEVDKRVAEKRRIREEKLKHEMEERLKKEKEDREIKNRANMLEKSKLSSKSQFGTNSITNSKQNASRLATRSNF